MKKETKELTEEQKKFLDHCGDLLKKVKLDKIPKECSGYKIPIPKGFELMSTHDDWAQTYLVMRKSIYDKRVELIKEIIEQCDSSCSKEVIAILNGDFDVGLVIFVKKLKDKKIVGD